MKFNAILFSVALCTALFLQVASGLPNKAKDKSNEEFFKGDLEFLDIPSGSNHNPGSDSKSESFLPANAHLMIPGANYTVIPASDPANHRANVPYLLCDTTNGSPPALQVMWNADSLYTIGQEWCCTYNKWCNNLMTGFVYPMAATDICDWVRTSKEPGQRCVRCHFAASANKWIATACRRSGGNVDGKAGGRVRWPLGHEVNAYTAGKGPGNWKQATTNTDGN